MYLGLLDRKSRLQISIAPAVCDGISSRRRCLGIAGMYLQNPPTRCTAYRELPPQRGWLICHDTPRLPGCISHNVPSHVCRATALLLLERGFPPKPRSLLPALPPSATPTLKLSARQVSWAFCRLPALTSLEILFATYILV